MRDGRSGEEKTLRTPATTKPNLPFYRQVFPFEVLEPADTGGFVCALHRLPEALADSQRRGLTLLDNDTGELLWEPPQGKENT